MIGYELQIVFFLVAAMTRERRRSIVEEFYWAIRSATVCFLTIIIAAPGAARQLGTISAPKSVGKFYAASPLLSEMRSNHLIKLNNNFWPVYCMDGLGREVVPGYADWFPHCYHYEEESTMRYAQAFAIAIAGAFLIAAAPARAAPLSDEVLISVGGVLISSTVLEEGAETPTRIIFPASIFVAPFTVYLLEPGTNIVSDVFQACQVNCLFAVSDGDPGLQVLIGPGCDPGPGNPFGLPFGPVGAGASCLEETGGFQDISALLNTVNQGSVVVRSDVPEPAMLGLLGLGLLAMGFGRRKRAA